MIFELLLIPAIFIISLILLLRNFKVSFGVLLVLSILLHKEDFSIYVWDVLPVRIFMFALLTYALGNAAYFLYLHRNKKDKVLLRIKESFSDIFILSLLSLWFFKAISILFSQNVANSLFLMAFFTTIVALGILMYKRFRNYPDLVLRYIRFYILVAFLACVFGFIQMALFYTTGVTIGALWSIPGNIARVGSTFWDVNHFAALIASLLPVLGVSILFRVSWKKRLAYSMGFLIMLSTLLLTNSRSAFMIAFFSFISFLILIIYRKYKVKGVLAIVFSLVIITIPLLVEYSDRASPFRARVKNYFHYRIDSFDSHILLLKGTFAVFEEFPVFGGGYGSFYEHFSNTNVAAEYFGRDPAALNTRVPAHTIWGEFLAESGILGFAAFVVFVFTVIGTLIYASQTLRKKREILLTAAMASSLIGWLIAGIFYSYKSEFFWLVFFLYFLYGVGILGSIPNYERMWSFIVRSGVFTFTVLLATASVVLFWGLGSTELIPWDEAIYAKVAKNMVMSGNFLDLTWQNLTTLWFEKPPLYMWFSAATMSVLGFTSLAARIPSAVFGLLTVVVVYFFGKKLHNKTTGFISAFSLLTTMHFVYYSRSSMLDVTTTFFITLSLFLYWGAKEGSKGGSSRISWMLSGFVMGLAVMTKGVVGLLPLGIIPFYELYLYVTKSQKLSKSLLLNYSYLIMCLLLGFLPWHLEMYRRHGQEFFDQYIGYHVLRRASEGIEDKGRPFFWYIDVLRVSMRLWFIALVPALLSSFLISFDKVRNWIRIKTKLSLSSYNADVFLVIYFLFIFFFFSVAESKLVWYIIPLYPAAALLIGSLTERILRILSPYSIVKRTLLTFALVCVVFTYFYVNRIFAYPGNLTGKQVYVIEEKERIFGLESLLYVDSIETPLVLFYSDSPFEEISFRDLEARLASAPYDKDIIFVTKESRLRGFMAENPKVKLSAQRDEWVLGYLPSALSQDTDDAKALKKEIQQLNEEIERRRLTGGYSFDLVIEVRELQQQLDSIEARLNSHVSVDNAQGNN